MITLKRKLTVAENVSTLSEPIYLYKGDGNINIIIDLRRILKKIFFDSDVFSSVCILKPSGEQLVLDTQVIQDNQVNVLLTKDIMDEAIELGVHRVIIHLLDSMGNRYTIPSFEIVIEKPICDMTTPIIPVVQTVLLDVNGNELIDKNGNTLIMKEE